MSELKTIKRDEANALVVSTAKEVSELIIGRLKEINLGQRSLLYGRIVSLAFQAHFHVLLHTADEALLLKEKKQAEARP